MAKMCENLEGLDEKREEAQEHSRRYRQRMTEAYGRTLRGKGSTCKWVLSFSLDGWKRFNGPH